MAANSDLSARSRRDPLSIDTLLTAETTPTAWDAAIFYWMEGSPYLMATLLRRDEPVPNEARNWLADLVEGSIKRGKPGRPKKKVSLQEMAANFIHEVEVKNAFKFQLKIEQGRKFSRGAKMGTAKERALEVVAEQFGLTPDKVSQIVYPRKSGVEN